MSAIYSGLSLPEWCRFHFNELFMFMFIIYIYSSSIIPFFFLIDFILVSECRDTSLTQTKPINPTL